MQIVIRIIAASLLLTAAIPAVPAQTPANPGSAASANSPDAALRGLFDAIGDFDLWAVWVRLPGEMQTRIKTLVRDGVQKVPQEEYDRLLAQLRRAVNLLRQKNTLITTYLREEYPQQTGLPAVYTLAMQILAEALQLNALEYTQLLRGNWEAALREQVAPVTRRCAQALNNEPSALFIATLTGQPSPLGQFAAMKKIAIVQAELAGQVAVVRATNGEQTMDVQMQQLDGKWLPVEFIDDFEQNYRHAAKSVKKFDLFSSDNELQLNLVQSYIEVCLTQLENAKTVEEIRTIHQSLLAVINLIQNLLQH